jgi:hypothetical protein
MESPLGEAARGTGEEIANAGLVENFRLAAHGLGGMIFGAGEALNATAVALMTLFTDPGKFLEDLLRLPGVIEQLWEHRRQLWDHFVRLPPEEQSFQIGRLTGHLEAFLITIEAGNAAGDAMAEGMEISVPSEFSWLNASDGSAFIVATDRIVQLQTEAGYLVSAVSVGAGATGAFAMGIEDVKGLLGEGPEVEAVRERDPRGTGVVRPPRHHILPQKFRSWFERRGFRGQNNIDRFCVELDEAGHQALHGGGDWRLGRTWPNEWNNRIMRELMETESYLGRRLTSDEIITIARELMVEYGIDKPFVSFR